MFKLIISIYSLISASLYAITIPWPPNTYEGLIKTGYSNLFAIIIASSSVKTVEPAGLGIPASSIIASNLFLSSAASTISADVPKILTPISEIALINFIAVCPPNWQITPSGFSFSIISLTSSDVNGSKYNLSDVSKSVETVSGLLFAIIASYPNSRRAHTECTEQ